MLALRFLITEIIILQHYRRIEGTFSSLNGFFDLVSIQLFATLKLLNTQLAIHTISLMALLSVIAILCIFSRLSQIHYFLQRLSISDFQFSKTLTTYYVLNADSLRFLVDVNRVYGWALAVCIIVNLPSNAFFVIILSLERFRYPFKSFLMLTIVLIQFFYLFLVHLGAALLGVKMHQPVTVLWKCFYADVGKKARHNGKLKSTRNQLKRKWKLMTYIEQFSTANRYSLFSYGKWGPVTLVSLTKVCTFNFITCFVRNFLFSTSFTTAKFSFLLTNFYAM